MKPDTFTTESHRKGAVFDAIFALWLCGTMFFSYRVFIEAEILSKWYVFVGGGLLYGAAALILLRQPKIPIGTVTVATAGFLAYLFVRGVFNDRPQPDHFTLSLAAFATTYFAIKTMPERSQQQELIVVGVCLAQAIFGIMQFAGIWHSHRGFVVTGSFENPAGFAASLTAGFPCCLSFLGKRRLQPLFGAVAASVIALAVILSGSRAGILALIIVTAAYIGYEFRNTFARHRLRILLLAAIGFISLIIGLFLLKKDSAMGRIVIWENSCRMIADKPLIGFGSSGFMRDYMLYQADYFAEQPESPYTMLADHVTHPFNEYLSLSVEYGLIGLCLLIAAGIVLIHSVRRFEAAQLCLLSVGIFACFSYPLRYPFVLAVLTFGLSRFESAHTRLIQIERGCKVAGCMLIVTLALFLLRDIHFEKEWGTLAMRPLLPAQQNVEAEYAALYTRWNGNPLFLYNYGAVLNRAGNHLRSSEIMIRCTKYFNDPDVQQVLAENCIRLNNPDEAEKHYLLASSMVPNRFTPLYRLFMLYQSTGQKQKAARLRDTILRKPVKIPSPQIEWIKRETEARSRQIGETLQTGEGEVEAESCAGPRE